MPGKRFPSDRGKREELAKAAENIAKGALRIMSVVVNRDLTDEEIRLAATLPSKEAPFYLHAAAKIAEAVVKQDGTEHAPRTLNLTLVSGAESREKWLEEVKKARVIDVAPLPALAPPDKPDAA